MLKAIVRWLWPKDATPTAERQPERYVTRDEMDEALEKHAKDLEWEWTEMYEKFNKLHLRLAKRDTRRAKQDDQEEMDIPHVPSVIHHRRIGSV